MVDGEVKGCMLTETGWPEVLRAGRERGGLLGEALEGHTSKASERLQVFSVFTVKQNMQSHCGALGTAPRGTPITRRGFPVPTETVRGQEHRSEANSHRQLNAQKESTNMIQ